MDFQPDKEREVRAPVTGTTLHARSKVCSPLNINVINISI